MSDFLKCPEGTPPRMDYTREEIIEWWKRCEAVADCSKCPVEHENCRKLDEAMFDMFQRDANEIANKQRHIDSLLMANEGLRSNMRHLREENERLKAENERLHKENFWLSEEGGKSMSYLEKAVKAGPFMYHEVVQEALHEAGKDFSKLINKWNGEDAAVLLVAMKATIPQLERLCGESGEVLAEHLLKMTRTVLFEVPMEGKKNADDGQ